MKVIDAVKNCRCRLVVAVDGPDSVGKQTQVALLTKRLTTAGNTVTSVEIPFDDGTTYTRIYEMLSDGRATKYPSTFQGLMVANRLLFQAIHLEKLLTSNDIIVFDRWNASTYAYGRAAGIPVDELACTVDLVHKPDLTIILSGHAYKKADLDTYEADRQLQCRVSDFYVEWARTSCGRTYIVDANDTPEAVHETMWDIVCAALITTANAKVIDIAPYIKRQQAMTKIINDMDHNKGDSDDDTA
jgi:thymidylate kinase